MKEKPAEKKPAEKKPDEIKTGSTDEPKAGKKDAWSAAVGQTPSPYETPTDTSPAAAPSTKPGRLSDEYVRPENSDRAAAQAWQVVR